MSTLTAPDLAAIRRWRTSVLVVFGLAGVGVASWLSRLPSVRDGLEATTLAMGVLALGISIGSVAGFAVASRIAVRYSPRAVIRASLGVAMGGLLLAGVSGGVLPDYPLAMAGLILLGLGNGTCNVTMNVEGAAIERALRRPVMPWFHALYSIGAAVGASIGALAAALGISPSVQIPVVVAAMAVTTVFATRHLGTEPHARPGAIRRPRRAGARPGSRAAPCSSAWSSWACRSPTAPPTTGSPSRWSTGTAADRASRRSRSTCSRSPSW
ncbi:hypothetical protein GCM10025881_09050 [Pseudolysinimonas kribbensis]|uniref:MFS transporter n=1 Tax=Pseudolysinimonas kribbensis TaxID=433641 RepID=A0ABQ6K2T5_9MICO|nr:hypothetical protein [Pseudolysinimonas kribbensis]GMA94081.1 hypothetical protein GCM10025881_09050 [Pseudolysinimonas kribbensis]